MNIIGNAHPLCVQYHKQHPACMVSRENTIPSFQRAAGAGASFVEFDVQVTRDNIPVIWHDDEVVFQRNSQVHRQPVSSFAASEFQSLRQPGSSVQLLRKSIRPTGISDTDFDEWNVEDETAGLPTLSEVLSSVPESIGFDLEVKLTTPPDQITQPDEVERMVQPILQTVQQALQTSARKMFFSSFDPEICLALRERQQDLPVFLLSTGPVSFKPHGDKRRNSVAEAVAFACSAGLHGLVLDSGCFKTEPNAPREAEQLGLTTLTYGLTNNDPEWILRQQELGVAAVIVDNVPAIVKALAS